jgi:uncharacterized protein YndB with AHSA1/START domain
MKWIVRIVGGLIVLFVLAVGGLWLAGLRPGHGHMVTEVAIDRPAAQVFRWLTEDERVKKWISGLEEVRPLSAPADGSEVGKKFHMVEVYKNERVEMEMVVTKFEKDRALSILVSSAGDPNNGFSETGDYTLTEQDGKTRLRFDVQAKYFGFLPRLFEPLITPEANAKLQEDFHRLKGLSEAEPVLAARPAKVAPEMERLKFYLGEWDYTETYPKSGSYPSGGKNGGVYTSKLGPGGNSLINTFHSQGPVGDFEGLLVMTWDPKEKAYKAYVFGNEFPGAIVETGQFEGDALVFRSEFAVGGMSMKLRNVTRVTSAGTLVSEEFVAMKDAPETMLVRVEAKKR